ncbi:MAG: MBL fold metallo-hydrolase [Kofleriaceae bacterium]|nr:MBL fold metallo-hydrolase [Kofleriaceae bacterium]MCL4228227.1 MBL fold metallo-hydrolase [Myxococcales bacterium]
MSHDLTIHFHGVRGSIAAPGVATARVGGNTSCVEVIAGDNRIVLDAGTGLRGLGDRLIASGPSATTILLSHLHWDHIQGLPFFTPIYIAGNWIEVVSGPNGAMPLEAALRRQMSAPFFPVEFDDVARQVRVREPRVGEAFAVGDVRVTMAKLNHPDPVYGYRLDHQGASIVYATDTEHFACVDPALARLAAGADVLIYDAQYTPEEYPGKVGWGHSTWEAAVALARTAGVRQLVLYHHDPRRADDAVEALEARARAAFPGTIAAREGGVLHVEARATRRTEVVTAVTAA